MNLTRMNDEGLLNTTDALVREERELLTTILHHLREIERRRLFSSLGYKSLFEMATRRFGYSEDQAYRRIAAMRLIKELPEVEEKISSGEITLTHIGLAHSLFRQEKKQKQKEMPRAEKLSVIERISGTPVREAERITLSISCSPEAARPDRTQPLGENHIELKFVAPAEIQEKIDRLKGLLAHRYPNLSLGELFDKLCDLGLEEWNPGRPTKEEKRAQAENKTSGAILTETEDKGPTAFNDVGIDEIEVYGIGSDAICGNDKRSAAPRKRCVKARAKTGAGSNTTVSPGRTSSVRASAVRVVWRRAESSCENCGSLFALEIDHKIPRAKGGSSDLDNLRLVCRSCNQRAAIETLGQETMDHYINS